MVIVDLNALEIGSELLLERNREIQSGMESRAVIAVFAFPGVRSCESCLDLSARKVNGKLRDTSFWCANPGIDTDVQGFNDSVRDEQHEPRCDLSLVRRGYRGARLPLDMSRTESSSYQSRLFRTMLGRLGRNAR